MVNFNFIDLIHWFLILFNFNLLIDLFFFQLPPHPADQTERSAPPRLDRVSPARKTDTSPWLPMPVSAATTCASTVWPTPKPVQATPSSILNVDSASGRKPLPATKVSPSTQILKLNLSENSLTGFHQPQIQPFHRSLQRQRWQIRSPLPERQQLPDLSLAPHPTERFLIRPVAISSTPVPPEYPAKW